MPYADPAEYRAYQKQYRQKNKSKLNAYSVKYYASCAEERTKYMKTWHRNNPRAQILSAAKMRAKKKGLPFSLTVEDIVIPAVCPYFGIPLKAADGRMNDNSPSLDRISPASGYVPGNVEVISWRANRLKGDGTAEEHRKIANRMNALDNFSCEEPQPT